MTYFKIEAVLRKDIRKLKHKLISYSGLRFFRLPPPAIYHLVPHKTPQQPALGVGWKPRIFILDHII